MSKWHFWKGLWCRVHLYCSWVTDGPSHLNVCTLSPCDSTIANEKATWPQAINHEVHLGHLISIWHTSGSKRRITLVAAAMLPSVLTARDVTFSRPATVFFYMLNCFHLGLSTVRWFSTFPVHTHTVSNDLSWYFRNNHSLWSIKKLENSRTFLQVRSVLLNLFCAKLQ